MKIENVAVVKAKSLYELHSEWLGFIAINNDIKKFLETKQELGIRPCIEENIAFKQLIPYMIFKYKDSVFLYDRGNGGNEKRLHGKCSIGIGGHLKFEEGREIPMKMWGEREFYEEVEYSGKFNSNVVGLLNDSNTIVGKVHLGIATLIKGTNSNIKVKSEMKSGELVSIKECYEKYYNKLEIWSQFCILELMKKKDY